MVYVCLTIIFGLLKRFPLTTNVNLANVLTSFAKHFFPVHGKDAMGKKSKFDIPTAYQRKLNLLNSALEGQFKRGKESEE